MLIRTADLRDLASLFAVPLRVGGHAHEEVFFLVRDGMLEAHRGPLHARVPLCVWARDRVLGWAIWKALPDARHAPETMDLERALRLVDTSILPVQTRAVFQQQGERRARVDVLVWHPRDRLDPITVAPLGMRVVWQTLALAWAERFWGEGTVGPRGSWGRARTPVDLARFNLVIRSPALPAKAEPQKILTRAVARHLGQGDHAGIAVIPPAWLDQAVGVLPHRDGLALVGRCWWLSIGGVFEGPINS